jgi:hypothetical protein
MNFEDTLLTREPIPIEGSRRVTYSLSSGELDAIADALGTLREIAGMGEGWLTTSALAKAALAQLDGLVSE